MSYQKGIVIPLEQNTDEWLKWRDTGIGGSDAAVIKLGNVYGKTPSVLWSQKLGCAVATFSEAQQEHIERGHQLEPEARKVFSEQTGFRVRPVCMQSVTHPFMLASIDGITDDLEVGVEIKAPAEKMFKQIVDNDAIPPYYVTQIQHQLYVSGAREFYFWAFNPNVKPYVFLKRVEPDYAYIEELVRLETIFQWHVDRGLQPNDERLDMQLSGEIFTGLILLSGAATVGKDECIGKIYETTLGVTRFSPSDPLRDIYTQMTGITHERLNANKEKHRPALVALGHGMRQYVPNVWIDAVFNQDTGIFEAMQNKGAMITSTRYVNEVSHGRKHAARLGVPCHLIYITRPGVKFANETEAATLPLVKSIADIILVNDCDANTTLGLEATKLAALASLRASKYGEQRTIKASEYERLVKTKKVLDDAKRKKTRR